MPETTHPTPAVPPPNRESRGPASPTRRHVLAGAATLAVFGVPASTMPTAAAPEPATVWFREALARLLAERTPVAERVTIDMPEKAENGNMVPFSIAIDSPMTAADHIQTITVLSPQNPHAVIATFELSPASGVARVAGRLRLARTQEVLVIAETNTGKVFQGTRRVDVTVGGCGTG